MGFSGFLLWCVSMVMLLAANGQALAQNDCDDLNGGLVDGCPVIVPPKGNGNQFKLTNSCNSPVQLAVRYLDVDNNWKTRGWYSFESGESGYLVQKDVRLQSKNRIWYYYAESTSGSRRFWRGDHDVDFDGRTLRMVKMQADEEHTGDYEWRITCNRDSSIGQFKLTNNCDLPVRLAIRYRDLKSNWVTDGWYQVGSRKITFLVDKDDFRLESRNRTWYYYAESTGGGRRVIWAGDHELNFSGQTLRMRTMEADEEHTGDFEWTITCR
jgi:uncharacterized membrane protein